MPTISQAIDVGNYTTYGLRDEETAPRIRKSVMAQLVGRRIEVKPNNVIIDCNDYGSWHIGYQARRYGPAAHELMDLNKLEPENYVPMVLSTLGPLSKRVCSYEVELYWSLPEPSLICRGRDDVGEEVPMTVAERLERALARTFRYRYTDHTGSYDMIVAIKPKPCRPEGLDAVVFAREDGYLSEDGTVLGVDIGGGTIEMVTLDSDNTLLDRESYNGSNGTALAGVVAITSQLADNPEFRQAVDGIPNAGIIMDALCNPVMGNDGKPRYEYPLDNNQRFDFSDIFRKVARSYYLEIQSKCSNRFKGSTGSEGMSGIMFFGGGANILRAPLKNFEIYIPDQPELSNVQALYRLCNQRVGVMVG